jgi:hypothetical protein
MDSGDTGEPIRAPTFRSTISIPAGTRDNRADCTTPIPVFDGHLKSE